MRVKTFHPVKTLKGNVGNSDIVYFSGSGNRVFARAHARPYNPQSPDQQKVRAYLATATKAWAGLTDEQRQGWLDYAAAYFSTNGEGESIDPSGIATYVRANSIRQVLALPLASAPPAASPPPPITGIEQFPADDDHALALGFAHNIAPVTGFKVLIRATPPSLTQARAPRLADVRYVRGVSPDSAYPLGASGAIVSISSTRYAYPEGARFGIEARVVRVADGIVSAPAYAEFRKAIP